MSYTFTIEQGAYALRGPKDYKLIYQIKTLPPKYRRWDGSIMAWIIAPEVVQQVAEMIRQCGYPAPTIPRFDPAAAIFTKTFTVDYIGQAKERDSKPAFALGSIKGYWSIEFPETVLREWFESDSNKREKIASGQTHYQVLCVVETVSDADIKAAYRRLARQWHPDVCHEDGAADKFREIQKAYEVLSTNRARYNAGLYFEREAQRQQPQPPEYHFADRTRGRFSDNYRPPLRCGLITVEGRQTGYKFTVSKIIKWDDITDDAGRVMVSTWNKNLGVFDPATGRRKGEIEIKWI